ncbi:VOC family protein [Kiritimatiellota bacterium B12222]|nr:VOC family protein [Kiritimatiellota bacterium B12222]
MENPLMIKQLAHVCIHAKDLEETEAFYCGILKCSLGFEFFRGETRMGFYIQLGNQSFLEFFSGEPGEVGNIRHLALEVEDMDVLIQRLREHGVEVGEKKRGADHSWQIWCKDPNGVDIEFHQYTPESLQLRGGRCEVNW